jgi:hypothetical protein
VEDRPFRGSRSTIEQFRAQRKPVGRRRRPRARRCLLKRCEQRFTPTRPQAHYCSATCRTKATQWRCWKAQKRYRDTVRIAERRILPRDAAARGSSPSHIASTTCDRPGCLPHVPPKTAIPCSASAAGPVVVRSIASSNGSAGCAAGTGGDDRRRDPPRSDPSGAYCARRGVASTVCVPREKRGGRVQKCAHFRVSA